MVCANWLLGIAAVLIFAFGVWPWMNVWVVGICAVVVLVVALTGVKCKYCEKVEVMEPAVKPVVKKVKKKRK